MLDGHPSPSRAPVLTDGVVTLRPHHEGDVDGVLEQCRDPLSQRWTTVPLDYTRDDARKFVTEVVPQGWPEGRWAFAVEAVDDDGVPRFCGTVELRDEGNRRAEIAYGAHPWARGRGLVHRALELLLDWGFTDRHLRTVVWWANVGNWASRRAAWRLGFSCDGTLPRWLPRRGDLLDGWVGTLHVDDPREPRTAWLRAPVLTGERLVLRPLRDDDLDRVVEGLGDERAVRWLPGVPSPFTAADGEAWLLQQGERAASGSGLGWALADPGTGSLLGFISLRHLHERHDAEVGFWTHPGSRGRGLMTEACRLVVEHAFTDPDCGGLGLVRLEVGAAEGNTASRHVIEAAGFTRSGVQRRSLRMHDGTLADDVTYDVLAEEHATSG